MEINVARLTEFHTNCACGDDMHIVVDLDENGELTVQAVPQRTDVVVHIADVTHHLGELRSVQLPDGQLRTEQLGAEADDPMARLAQLLEATAWLAEQLDAGTVKASEIRERFGMPAPTTAPDAPDGHDTPPDADTAAVAPSAPQRGRPKRPGGGG